MSLYSYKGFCTMTGPEDDVSALVKQAEHYQSIIRRNLQRLHLAEGKVAILRNENNKLRRRMEVARNVATMLWDCLNTGSRPSAVKCLETWPWLAVPEARSQSEEE